jgi:alkylated DNA repair dioxygenase AlkB
MGWHCDNNQNESLILCVVLTSLESRPVHIRPDGSPEEGDEEIIIFVGKGDSYSMDGEMQKHYQHCLPKKPKDPGCSNVLVFRHGMEKLLTRTLVKL